MNDEKQLAIIIPVYEAEFLKTVLDSIAAQEDKRFRVYIGDDCSPDDIKKICDSFSNRVEIVYRRFEKNLGQKSLVSHWNRCIRLSIEPWIWLFCDDDVMDPGCVKIFYNNFQTIKNNYNLCRFCTSTIDSNGRLIRINPPHPQIESGVHFAYHRLNFRRSSYISEFIFSRMAFEKNGGIIDLPLAWCSDDATAIAFAGDSGIYTMQGAYVYWRQSEQNLSSWGLEYQDEKIAAAFGYMRWLNERFQSTIQSRLGIEAHLWIQYQQKWLYRHFKCVAPLKIKIILKLIEQKESFWNDSPLRKIVKLIWINAEFFIKKLMTLCMR